MNGSRDDADCLGPCMPYHHRVHSGMSCHSDIGLQSSMRSIAFVCQQAGKPPRSDLSHHWWILRMSCDSHINWKEGIFI